MHDRLTILIVDDEQQSRSLIKKFIQDESDQSNMHEASSVDEAEAIISEKHPELLFLDVQLKTETGFDLLDKIPVLNFDIIFTTAHSEYALKAFRYSAVDYLVKPLDREEFSQAFNKAKLRIRKEQPIKPQQLELLSQYARSGGCLPERLTIPTLDGLLFIRIGDILYCRALNNYTEFILSDNKKILSSHTLGYYEDCLIPHHFFRAHRSFLINLAHIKMYKRGDGGTIVMNNDQEIEVSRNNKEAFLKLFKL
jgi:two-component system LytT family response regulator